MVLSVKREMAEQQLRARQMVLQQQAASAVAAASKTQREVGHFFPTYPLCRFCVYYIPAKCCFDLPAWGTLPSRAGTDTWGALCPQVFLFVSLPCRCYTHCFALCHASPTAKRNLPPLTRPQLTACMGCASPTYLPHLLVINLHACCYILP